MLELGLTHDRLAQQEKGRMVHSLRLCRILGPKDIFFVAYLIGPCSCEVELRSGQYYLAYRSM